MMRVLIPPSIDLRPGPIPLGDDESHHLRVRRASDGDCGTGYDGQGIAASGTLHRHGAEWELRVEHVERHDVPPECVLAVAAGDKERFGWLVEKATELAVTRIIPIETERQRHVESRIRSAGLAKLRRRTLEACKQSGNPWALLIDDVTVLETLRPSAATNWFVAAQQGMVCPRIAPHAAVGWFIGPEGGLTESESDFCASVFQAKSVTLAPHVLRFETAAIAAAVVTGLRRSQP